MKKFLLLSLATLGMLAPSPQASAFTAKEFVEKGKIWKTFYSNYNVDLKNVSGNVAYYSEGNNSLELANNNTYIVFSGIIDQNKMPGSEGCYMYLQINNNRVTIPANVGKRTIQVGAQWGYPMCYDFNAVLIGLNINGYTYFVLPYFDLSKSDWTNTTLSGTAGTTTDGEYYIKFGNCTIVKCTSAYGEYYFNNSRYSGNYYALADGINVGGILLQTYSQTNASVTDSQYTFNTNGTSKSNKTERNYTANITFDGKDFYIFNWNNTGNPWNTDVSSSLYSEEQKYKALWFPEELELEVLPCEYLSGYYSNSDATSIFTSEMGANFNKSTYDITSVTGQTEGSIRHSSILTNKWLLNTNSTLYNIKSIDFVPYMTIDHDLYWYNKGYLSYGKYIENTHYTITSPLEIDYTHQVYISRKEFGYGTITTGNSDKYIYVNCELYNKKNTAFVKDYELYIMPTIDNPNYNSADFNDENGHVNATRIDLLKYAHDFVPSESDRRVRKLATDEGEEVNPFEGYKYNLLIPENDLKAKDASGNGKYSLYVKTIYTDESGLEPTFHALTTLGDTTTGVEDIIDNGASDEDAPVVYYNMNGVQMNGDNLTPGIYIKKQGNTTSKVVIR